MAAATRRAGSQVRRGTAGGDHLFGMASSRYSRRGVERSVCGAASVAVRGSSEDAVPIDEGPARLANLERRPEWAPLIRSVTV
jgi:hypothetical protein